MYAGEGGSRHKDSVSPQLYCIMLHAAQRPTSTLLMPPPYLCCAQDAYKADPDLMAAAVADLLAVKDRDPACEQYTQCLLNFKGYQAIQCHRVSHWLWMQGRQVGGGNSYRAQKIAGRRYREGHSRIGRLGETGSALGGLHNRAGSDLLVMTLCSQNFC